MKRELLFGISDVLGKLIENDMMMLMNDKQNILISVYVGGLGGLFLGSQLLFFADCEVFTCSLSFFLTGCSLLGFTELIFFFSWGLIKNILKHFKKTTVIDVKA